ncbi:hypothetical protein TTHERM_000431329 (macronuclear) [Tetrahymena thermophila SB210]|uniref:Uncharacterized protein n=1 Tax=Tetrahymena thermophila (strain SB210) TaxID=312017 RepID=W7XHL5_TETTS|nr:hypothetical protein TTHERM_000431329 [Tetrahymena thermophila SB210]EWS72614.1 hypothetical protein TTHERM_000431329 [Tetrahymena thermophila SB210]|eukprot:XP_012654897.1 hypothetical protein TTHERM_000431329 [Tetrahymena thermophila SB210]
MEIDPTHSVRNPDLHTILDGSNQLIDSLTLKQQRQFVSDFLANQAPKLQEQEIPV